MHSKTFLNTAGSIIKKESKSKNKNIKNSNQKITISTQNNFTTNNFANNTSNFLSTTKKEKEDKEGKEEEIKTTIKNLKMKHIPLDLRPKLTRAMRRRMTKFERKLVTLRQLKRKLNFPMRKFAVPTKQA